MEKKQEKNVKKKWVQRLIMVHVSWPGHPSYQKNKQKKEARLKKTNKGQAQIDIHYFFLFVVF